MMKRVVVFVVLCLSSIASVARYHVVKNSSTLHDLVEKYAYSMVCFAPSGSLQGEDLDSDEKRERKQAFHALENMVKSASRHGEYKAYADRDIGFLLVDVASKHACNVADEYDADRQPLCVVFEQGADRQKKLVRPAHARDLLKFLQSEGGTSLQDFMKDRKEDARLARQERIASYYAYATAYPYGYGPYAWSPYWRSPYAGWGFYAGW